MNGSERAALDWTRIEGAVFRVRHHYRYVYTAPVFDMRQRLVMVPPDQHLDQTLRSWSLDVRGASGQRTVEWSTDMFGNRVCRVVAEHVEHAVDFDAGFVVERRAQDGPPVACLPAPEVEAYRSHTALTAPDHRIRAAATGISSRARTGSQLVEQAHDWTARAIEYESGVTGTQTPAAMALHLGRGVCQDYAHIMLSVLRTLGIACRYVSGHLVGEGAPHAWVEVLSATSEPDCYAVTAFDPTHHRRAGANYISVAVGRDFADVTMTSGVFSGAATGRLHWSKQAEVVDVELSKSEQDAAA